MRSGRYALVVQQKLALVSQIAFASAAWQITKIVDRPAFVR